jgi:Holliday junction DNA helicase RuvA
MIGSLNGTVVIRDDPFIILNVNGVGYKIHAASEVLARVTKPDFELQVFIYTHVREDLMELYGFLDYSDLKLFESLINVSGVGPRTAIGIFSIGSTDQIKQAIMEADASFFSQVPRLGTKNAQKIIIELKNKIGGGDLDLSDGSLNNKNELSSALKAFGFSKDEINDAARKVDRSKSVEFQIKEALKYLGK